ncbi:palmitoyltransferase ZDHHC19-like [Anolis carolinensis]|uniref:palmitoyltransferase ZDHHC19-like n=1 Tax=Anolis carolinensis TaxID=28377 RepID=UPI002F2B2DBF
MESILDGRHTLTSVALSLCYFACLLTCGCLFLTHECSWLALHVSKTIPVVFSTFLVLTLAFFLLTSFTGTTIFYKAFSGMDEELMTQAMTRYYTNWRWCHKCQLYCRPKASRCHRCKTRVKGFVHCWMWINHCVGSKNYCFYLLLLLSQSCYELAILVCCHIYAAFNTQRDFSNDKQCMSIVTIGAAFSLLCLLILLCIQIVIFSDIRRQAKSKVQTGCSVECLDPNEDSSSSSSSSKYQATHCCRLSPASRILSASDV